MPVTGLISIRLNVLSIFECATLESKYSTRIQNFEHSSSPSNLIAKVFSINLLAIA